MQNDVFDLLMEAGAEFGIKPFGIRAMLSMAVEKSYRLVGRELSIEYSALESGLDRFVHPNKGEFVGRDALVRWREKGFANRFVTLEVDGVTDADARGSEPILRDGELVGRATYGRLWLARRQVAGARHGAARSRRDRQRSSRSPSSASRTGPWLSRKAPSTRPMRG